MEKELEVKNKNVFVFTGSITKSGEKLYIRIPKAIKPLIRRDKVYKITLEELD